MGWNESIYFVPCFLSDDGSVCRRSAGLEAESSGSRAFGCSVQLDVNLSEGRQKLSDGLIPPHSERCFKTKGIKLGWGLHFIPVDVPHSQRATKE